MNLEKTALDQDEGFSMMAEREGLRKMAAVDVWESASNQWCGWREQFMVTWASSSGPLRRGGCVVP